MRFCSPARRRARRCALLLGVLGSGGAPAFAQPAPPAAARHVDINEYYVEGNSVLSDPEIEQAVYPYLGPDRTLDDVEKARVALQKAYETKGLKTVFVEIPQQNIVGGRVVLAVTEAKIGTVAVTGARHTSDKTVTAALPAVAAGTVPDLNAFSNQLTALNSRSGDRQVTPQLKAGAQPGTVDVDLAVEDKLPLHGGIEFSDRYSRDTTKTRVQANLRYDDLWGLGHSVSAFYAVAPERRSDSEVFVGSYGLPITDTLRLDLTGLVSNSDVATVGDTDVLGDGHSVTAVLTKTLPSAGGLFHRVTLSVAYKDFKENTSFPNADPTQAPITYFPIALGYAGTLTQDKGTLGFDLTGTFAFRGLGSGSAAFDTKRFRATGGFAYVHAGLNYLRTLPGDAQLYTSVEGQLANEPLVSNEQMAAGGAGSVRGYLQSEAIGDNGVIASAEFRTPSFAKAIGLFDELRGIAFVDGGRVWIIDPLPEQQESFGLLGVGAGLRVKLFGHVSGDLDLAFPLKSNGVTRVGQTRLHFRLATDF
jgi:hemolysin activation/secretion protein